MKPTKIILSSGFAIFIIIILFINYQTHFSAEAKKGKVNIEKIKKVKIGMGVDDVFTIMGKPDDIDYCDGMAKLSKAYNYKTNDESFVNVTVCFDSNMKVKETYFPK